MKRLLTLLLVCAIPRLAFSGGFAIPEQSAKAAAMAAAFTGLANDPSAIYFNPAGIAFLKGMNLQVGSSFIIPDAQYQNPAVSNTIYEQKNQFFVVPNIYYTMEWEMGLTFGAGIYAPYGLGTAWDEDWPGDYLSREIELHNIHFAGVVAYKLLDNLSVAVSFAWSYSTATLVKKSESAGLASDVSLEGTGSGIHFGVSALYKPLDILSIGVNYRTAADLVLTGDIKFAGANTSAVTDLEGEGEVTLPLPSVINLGVALDPVEDLTVLFQVDMTGWSDYKKLEIINKDNPEGSTSSPRNWEDTQTYRFGVEYRGLEMLALRAGFLLDGGPVGNEFTEPSLPDNDRVGYTLGAGYAINDQMTLDAYLLLLSWDEKNVTGNHFDFNGYYNTAATLSGISFTYKF